MSAHATPVLSGAIPSFELCMTQWERLGDSFTNLKPWTEIGLKWATKYYKRMDDTRAYIVAMCQFSSFLSVLTFDFTPVAPVINPCIRFSWIESQWEVEYAEYAKKVILDVVRDSDLSTGTN
jgi:hypothetical protein